jgi:hypothetical protein
MHLKPTQTKQKATNFLVAFSLGLTYANQIDNLRKLPHGGTGGI